MRTLLILISNFAYSLMACLYFWQYNWEVNFNNISLIGPVICAASFTLWICLFIKGTTHSKLYSPKTKMMVRVAMIIDILWQGALAYIFIFVEDKEGKFATKEAIFDYAYYIAIAGNSIWLYSDYFM